MTDPAPAAASPDLGSDEFGSDEFGASERGRPHHDAERSLDGLSRSGRTTAAVLMTLLIAGFALARYLTPAEEGLGTHQQLGLPPCSMRVIAGIPCPACGMTTSFSHFTRGQWLGSLSANTGGFVLALLCLALIPLLARAALTGRWALPRMSRDPDSPSRRPEWWGVVGMSLVGTVTLIDWAFRLAE